MPGSHTAMPASAATLSSRAPKPVRLPSGLIYVNTSMPGLCRVRRGTAFRYRKADGQWVTDPEEIARIKRLAIPPAYTDVWICPLPQGHLQATGLDARGRRQYRYHADWRLHRDQSKFDRLQAFGHALPRIRARVARDLAVQSAQPLSRNAVLAALVQLLDTTYLRVGNEEYASNNRSYGLTTLRMSHAGLRGNVLRLRFRGKSGVQQEATLDDPRVARIVRRCQQLPGQELFQYLDEDGTPHSVGSTDVNDYLREATGGAENEPHFTAKYFRTWHGTVQALELTRLACSQDKDTAYNAQTIVDAVARQLGNTPAVCKKAYIHPAVLEWGSRIASDADASIQSVWSHIAKDTTTPRRLHAAERRLLAFLHHLTKHPSSK